MDHILVCILIAHVEIHVKTHDHLMPSFLGVNLCAIPVEATVGVARLCVPRSMQVS